MEVSNHCPRAQTLIQVIFYYSYRYRYTESECCIFIRTKNAVEFEIYWDKTATGLMYQRDLLSFTDHFRLAVLCSAPSYFVGVSLLTNIL